MEKSFLNVKLFLRERCALLISYLPAGPLPICRQAVPTEGGVGRNYETITQINFNLED